jgi:lactoylglutathione lyase
MIIDHIAIWTNQIEKMKDYYVRYFNGTANKKYRYNENQFESYFVSFKSGARIELMHKPGIPGNLNDSVEKQYLGLIHLAFGVQNMDLVNQKLTELAKDGHKILRGPRKTGDGYWEFETLDPDNNRIEVSAVYKENH